MSCRSCVFVIPEKMKQELEPQRHKARKGFFFFLAKETRPGKNHALQAKYILMRKKVLLPKDVSFDFQGGLAENQKAFLSVLGVLSEAGGECSYVFSDTLP